MHVPGSYVPNSASGVYSFEDRQFLYNVGFLSVKNTLIVQHNSSYLTCFRFLVFFLPPDLLCSTLSFTASLS